MRPASSSSSSWTVSRTSPLASEMYAPPESSTRTLISAIPPGYLHPPPQHEQRSEEHGEAADEEIGECIGAVDVIPGARRAEQDQREADELALQRDPDRAPTPVEAHHQRGHARQREP